MDNVKRFLEYIRDRFGMEEGIFKGYVLLDMGDIWLSSEEAGRFKIKSFKRKGMRVARIFKDGKVKVTTSFIQMFGKEAKKNVIELDKEQALKFIEGYDVSIRPEGVEEGQIIVAYRGYPLGSGLFKNGKIKNQIPRGKRLKINL